MVLPTVSDITGSMTDMRSQYAASQPSKWLDRPDDMPSQGAGANWHFRDESRYYYMLEMARHIENEDPAVSQGISRFVDNVVKGGYTYVPETGVDSIDRLLKERWLTWTDDDNQQGVDLRRLHNWRTFEDLTARRILVDGDMGVSPITDGRLQAFEAHRIRGPNGSMSRVASMRSIVHGVEQNQRDQVIRFWLTRNEDDGFGLRRLNSFSRDVKGVRAWSMDDVTGQLEKNFFHLYNPKRFSQSRGVTAFHAVLNTAGMHADLQFATLVRAQLSAYIGFVHDIPLTAADYEPPDDDEVIDPVTGTRRRKGPDMFAGSSWYPDYAGEKIVPFTANVPNTEFFDHSKMLLTFIATSIGMPLILFLLDASETNFSSWRGAVDQFKISAERYQTMHAAAFHRPVVRFKQRQWLRQDRGFRSFFDIDGPAFFNHTWRFPKWRHVQPVEDVKAEVMELGNLLDSPRGIASRHNRDLDRIIRETCEDRSEAIRCGLDHVAELNRHPYVIENPQETVTWREVMPLPLSDNAQMQLLTGPALAGEPSPDQNQQSSNNPAS